MVAELQDRVYRMPGCCLQRDQGIKLAGAERGWLLHDHVRAKPYAQRRVGGVQVVRRADDEVIGLVARLAEEVLEGGAAGEEPGIGEVAVQDAYGVGDVVAGD